MLHVSYLDWFIIPYTFIYFFFKLTFDASVRVIVTLIPVVQWWSHGEFDRFCTLQKTKYLGKYLLNFDVGKIRPNKIFTEFLCDQSAYLFFQFTKEYAKFLGSFFKTKQLFSL